MAPEEAFEGAGAEGQGVAFFGDSFLGLGVEGDGDAMIVAGVGAHPAFNSLGSGLELSSLTVNILLKRSGKGTITEG